MTRVELRPCLMVQVDPMYFTFAVPDLVTAVRVLRIVISADLPPAPVALSLGVNVGGRRAPGPGHRLWLAEAQASHSVFVTWEHDPDLPWLYQDERRACVVAHPGDVLDVSLATLSLGRIVVCAMCEAAR